MYKSKNVILFNDDCMNVLKKMPDNHVDMILADQPYGTTECKWDIVIPLNPLWEQLKRIIKEKSVIAFTASQPFTSFLVTSNLDMFKHEWVWIKNRGSNFANTVREPMKEHESVLIFANKKWTYNKQMQERTGGGVERANYLMKYNDQPREGTRKFEGRPHHKMTKLRVPSTWQKFNCEVGLHPTQKPVDLMRYMLRTYTNEGDTVLDFTMGSGTTGVACIIEKRKFIGVELLEKYYKTAIDRIKKVGDEKRQRNNC